MAFLLCVGSFPLTLIEEIEGLSQVIGGDDGEPLHSLIDYFEVDRPFFE